MSLPASLLPTTASAHGGFGHTARRHIKVEPKCHLSEHFCDRVLFDYVSFIQLPQETKAFVSIIDVIIVVEYIANLLEL